MRKQDEFCSRTIYQQLPPIAKGAGAEGGEGGNHGFMLFARANFFRGCDEKDSEGTERRRSSRRDQKAAETNCPPHAEHEPHLSDRPTT